MRPNNAMPPVKVLTKAADLLGRLVEILDYQADQFSSESVESFSESNQKAYETISKLLSGASAECGRAMDFVDRARRQLP